MINEIVALRKKVKAMKADRDEALTEVAQLRETQLKFETFMHTVMDEKDQLEEDNVVLRSLLRDIRNYMVGAKPWPGSKYNCSPDVAIDHALDCPSLCELHRAEYDCSKKCQEFGHPTSAQGRVKAVVDDQISAPCPFG